MVALFDLRALRLTLGNRSVFQGDQANASAGRLPRHQRECNQMADMDRIAGISASASDGMAQRMETFLSETLHLGQGNAVEQKKFGGGAETDYEPE